MDDQEESGLPEAGGPSEAGGPPLPWEVDAGQEEEGRLRHNAFTGAKKKRYLKALTKTGCMLDASRLTGVPIRTVYNHQESDPEFYRHCQLALQLASAPIEITAYERGIVGIEEDRVYGGKVVGTRLKRSDSILRLLLQGSNRKKYGPRPGFSRKRLLKHEKKQMEKEIRARIKAGEPSIEQVKESILTKLEAIERHNGAKKLAAGWIKTEDGDWIPPGWVKVDCAGVAPPGPGSPEEQ